MNDFETISYAVDERVAIISLNRPKAMNAISQKMRQELKQAIDAAEGNDEVRVIIVRAEGRGFSSGTDLGEGLAGYETIDDQIQEEYKPIFMGIEQSNKPYIASIQGACVGIGAALAMVCDLAVMGDDAFVYLAFAGLSLVPDGGMSYHLVKQMGYKKAYQAYIESTRIPAQDCLAYGLVNKVVPSADLAAETLAWARKLAEGAPLAQKLGKRIMRGVDKSSFVEIFDQESAAQTTCSSSRDHAAAVTAFFEKKKAVFSGK